MDDLAVVGARHAAGRLQPGVRAEGGVVLDDEVQDRGSVVAVRPPLDVRVVLAARRET